MRIFVDCDVLLDVALGRDPFHQTSGKILDHLQSDAHQGFIAWHSVANLFYIAGKMIGEEAAKVFIVGLCQFVQVVPTGTDEVLQAANLPLTDFEDALQCVAAMTAQAEVIVTRNVADYHNSPLQVITPDELLTDLVV